MTNKIDLERTYEDIPDDELLRRWHKLDDYTLGAQEAMLAEIRKRPDLSHQIEAIEMRRKQQLEERAITQQVFDENFKRELCLRLKDLIPKKVFNTFGIARWHTPGTTLLNVSQKPPAAFVHFVLHLLGIPLPAFHPHLHVSRMGIIAITDDELFIIDLGADSSTELSPQRLITQIHNASVKSYPLDELSASCNASGSDSVLFLDGAVKIAATFPDSTVIINPICAEQIREAVRSSTIFACTDCNAEVPSDANRCPNCGIMFNQ